MAYCTYCGSEIVDGAPACAKCGHPTGAAPHRPQGGLRRTEGTAIASLVLGIAGFVACPLVPSILAIVFGAQAREKIRRDPTLDGDSLARAGVILGWAGIAVVVVVAVLVFVFLMVAPSAPVPDVDFSVMGVA